MPCLSWSHPITPPNCLFWSPTLLAPQHVFGQSPRSISICIPFTSTPVCALIGMIVSILSHGLSSAHRFGLRSVSTMTLRRARQAVAPVPAAGNVVSIALSMITIAVLTTCLGTGECTLGPRDLLTQLDSPASTVRTFMEAAPARKLA